MAEFLTPREGGCEYEPPESLWKMITSYVAESEWQEVKKQLGGDLVEQSIELHEEVGTLYEIWKEYREETQSTMVHRPRLAEPPSARGRLKQEIQLFVQSLQEKAKENGRDPNLVLSRHNSTVIDYALDSGYNSSSLPSTGRSSSGGSTPLMRGTPDSARSSTQVRVSMKEELAAMNDKLSMYKIQTVVEHLQEALQREVDTLLADTEFLQMCLSEEVDIRDETTVGISREPSLADMREERSKLEKSLLEKDSPVHDESKLPPRRDASTLSHKSIPPLPSKSMRPSSGTKSLGPLKASHNIQAIKLDTSTTPTSASRRPPGSGERSRGGLSNSIQALNQSTSHITIKTKQFKDKASSGDAASVKTPSPVSKQKSEGTPESEVKLQAASLVPTPPSSAKPKSGTQRPRSAQRFRKMVVDCRDGT